MVTRIKLGVSIINGSELWVVPVRVKVLTVVPTTEMEKEIKATTLMKKTNVRLGITEHPFLKHFLFF